MFKTSGCVYMYQNINEKFKQPNILWQLSKGKQGSAISGVVETECIEFIRERPSRDPLV